MRSQRAIHWLLFLLLSAILALALHGGVWGFQLFNAVHLLVYGALFYWIAGMAAYAFARLPAVWKWTGVGLVAAAIAGISCLPVYGIGHNETRSVNLYQLFQYGLH